MPKQSTNRLLAIYIAIAVTIAGSLAAIDSTILPFLYDRSPFLNRLHQRTPYLLDTIVDFIEILIGVLVAARAPILEERFKKLVRRRTALFDIISTSNFAADTGLSFIDVDGRVLASTKLLVDVAENKRSDSIIGVRYKYIFSDNLVRILTELIEKAKYTKTVAAMDIPEWSAYCTSTSIGPAVLYITPSFHENEYLGAIIVIRSTADVRNAENASIYYQMHYNVLFDTLPIGVAVFRPSIAADGGADGYLQTVNPALRKIAEGIPLPFNEPCSSVWPSFTQQSKLREAISTAVGNGTPVRSEFFSPALGKHLEVILAQLPGGRILCMVVDHTELRMNEQKVLALSDQYQRTVVNHTEYVRKVLEDIQSFNQVTADVVEMHLDEIKRLIPDVPAEVGAVLHDAACGMYLCLNQMLKYHNVAHLPFKETTLVHPAEVVTRLLEPVGNRFPEVSFSIGSLPGVVSNREILANIIEQLMVSLASLPVETPPARIEVSSRRDFLSTNITVSGWGFDTSPIFFETPTERHLMDWTVTSDLDLATTRRIVGTHGGEVFIGPTTDGAGVELSFSIGTPTA